MTLKAQRKTTSANFPGIRGFERFPQGKLLSQNIDFDGPVGTAYERCIGYTKPKHTHDRITITFPRGSSRSFIRVFPEAQKYNLTQDIVHVMVKNHEHEQGSISTIYDTFALFVTEEHYVAHLRKLGAKASEIRAFLSQTQAFAKSAVLAELITRYFFCKVLEQTPSPVELAHLESMILTEIFVQGQRAAAKTLAPLDDRPSPSDPPPSSDETALIRALEYIESHLFEKLEVEALVKSARASQATLFRLFKKELKVSPIQYVRNRRLDEARILLNTGRYQVGDVALLVAYEDISSFSKAYKARFRTAPSRLLPRA